MCHKLHPSTTTDLLTLPQWTDATFSVGGGAAGTHRLKPLPGLQQRGGQIFHQLIRTEQNVLRSYGDNTDKPTQLLTHFPYKYLTRMLYYASASVRRCT